MSTALPLICWYNLVLYFQLRGRGIRSSLVAASIVWGVIVVLITESLSFFKIIDQKHMLLAWTTAGVAAGCSAYRRYYKSRSLSQVSIDYTPLVWLPALLVAITGVTAIVSAPNNWDSLTYHLPRVMHWMQNKSVEQYPTNIPRQISMPPWAEYCLMQFDLLIGGDRLANCVQWFSMIGSLVGVSLIARQLRLDLKWQAFSTVFSSTIPMGILQSSSTQNDYVVTFWLISFIVFALQFYSSKLTEDLLLSSLALALSLLTKGTTYIFAFPFCMLLFVYIVKVHRLKAIGYLALVLTLVIIINSPHWFRNYRTFGDPLSTGSAVLANELISWKVLLSNTSRNIAIFYNTSSPVINNYIENIVTYIHQYINFDVNDRRSTFGNTYFHLDGIGILHEDCATAFIHFSFILISFMYIVGTLWRTDWLSFGYTISIVMGFLLFNLYLKWQPWHLRLLLPLFVLSSPSVALVLARFTTFDSRGRFSYLLSILLVFGSIPWLFNNSSRPLTGQKSVLWSDRVSQYFYNIPKIQDGYVDVATKIKASTCTRIGLAFGKDDLEYPLWVLLRDIRNLQIEHVAVKNVSEKLRKNTPNHCLTISVGPDKGLKLL